MMKKIIFTIGVLMSGVAYSQVGINTESPKATLDVEGKPSDITMVDGIIAPKLKGSELKAKDALYTDEQKSSLIYVTEALAASDTTSKTVNVTSIGYFYFDGNIWQKLNSGNIGGAGMEPWYNAATNQPADSNIQSIYQMGKVGVGVIPGANSIYSLHVLKNGTDTDNNGSGGIINNVSNKGEGSATGIFNTVQDYSTGGSNKINYGFSSIFEDKSTIPRAGYGASITYNLKGSKGNGTETNVHGLSSTVLLSAENGDMSTGYSYGNKSTALGSAISGNLTLTDLRAYSGYAYPSSSGSNTFTANQVFGGHIVARPEGDGIMNIDRIYGISGHFEPQKTGGTMNISNFAASLRSYTNIQGSGTYTIDKLMGLYIDKNQGGSTGTTINNSYGIYIKPFRFTGDTDTNAYNFYSEGANTKNYFGGKVGIGTTTPETRLEVNNGTTNGAIKIVDGTQGAGKVLTSDANGVGTWQEKASLKSVALGVYPASNITTMSDGNTAYKYSHSYVDLSPGKWIVSVGMTIYCFEANLTHFQHAYLSNSQTDLVKTDFESARSGGSFIAFAGKISNGPIGGVDQDIQRNANFLTGSSVINVTQPTRIYLILENKPANYWSYSTSAWENYFYATPVN